MKYYSAVKRNEILKHAKAQMNVKNTMLCEISQTKKYMYTYTLQFHLYKISRVRTIIETESRIEVVRGWQHGIRMRNSLF